MLDDAILAREYNGHAGEVIDFGVAYDQRIDVETSSSQDTGDTGEHSRLVLYKTIEDMALGWFARGSGRFVEDVGDCGLGGPRGRRVRNWEGRDAAMERFVGHWSVGIGFGELA